MKSFLKKYTLFIIIASVIAGLAIFIYLIPRVLVSSKRATPDNVAENIKSLSEDFELYYKSFNKFPDSILQIDSSIDPEKYGIYYRENAGIVQYIVVTDEQVDYEELKAQLPNVYSNDIFYQGFEEMYSYLKNSKTFYVMGPPFEESSYYISMKTFKKLGYEIYPNVYLITNKIAENAYNGAELEIKIYFYPNSFSYI